MVAKPANSINANGSSGLVQFDGTSSFTEIAPGNYGVLISSSSGVPSWLANGTTGQVLTATTSGTPSWAAAGGATQALFQAYLSANVSNVTGDNTAYKVAFNETAYNVSTCFSTSAYQFTAPSTGKYLFTCTVYGYGYVSQTASELNLVATSGTFYGINVNPTSSGTCVMNASWTIAMSSGDTAYLVFLAGTGSKTVSIGGLQGLSIFSGTYLSA